MALARLFNQAWRFSCVPEARRFARATRAVARAQEEVLLETLRANAGTVYGREHRFERIRSVADYQRQVPVGRYEDVRPYVARIAAGEQNVLTREAVEVLQPTSGTVGAEKLVPLTATLRRQYRRAVAAWMADLFSQRPAIMRGRAYWSISPALPERRSAGGLKIGFNDDAEYLGGLERLALAQILAMPGGITQVSTVEAFRYCTLFFLLRARDLALVSVWSPTFLTSLLAGLEEWVERLAEDIARGVPRVEGLTAPMRRQFTVAGDRRRAEELRGIFAGGGSWAEKLALVWPSLALISCWTDAGAGLCVPGVKALFPKVEIQGKGLMATEGVVSFPLAGKTGAALAVRSHFIEFQEMEGEGVRLAHEVETGCQYRVVLTTGGGLYRYGLMDVVEVVGREKECPLLRFMGKAEAVSDLAGEKLAEPFVRQVLEAAFEAWGIVPAFALMVSVRAPLGYRLYVQGAEAWGGERLSRWAGDLEKRLKGNPHYAWARGLGQIAAVEIVTLDPAAGSAWRVYEERRRAQGQRLGNIKPGVLALDVGWAEVLDPLRLPIAARQH